MQHDQIVFSVHVYWYLIYILLLRLTWQECTKSWFVYSPSASQNCWVITGSIRYVRNFGTSSVHGEKIRLEQSYSSEYMWNCNFCIIYALQGLCLSEDICPKKWFSMFFVKYKLTIICHCHWYHRSAIHRLWWTVGCTILLTQTL